MTNHLQKLRLKAASRQNWRCFYCGVPTWEDDVEGYAKFYCLSLGAAQKLKCTAEHLIARQDGGRNTKRNIVAACLFCNTTRHKSGKPKSAVEFGAYVSSRVVKSGWHSRDILDAMAARSEMLRQPKPPS